MKRFLSIVIVGLLAVSGCQKIFEKPKWQTDIVAPLIKTSLGIENIMQDTSLIQLDGDTIKLVSREKLYDVNIDSLVKLQVTPFTKNVKLSTLKLETQTMVDSITLGRLARTMAANGNNLGNIILASHGNWAPIPNTTNLTAGPFDIGLNQFFEYAVMNNPGGVMEITIENGFPLDIARLEFQLTNKTLVSPPVAQEVFLNINSGSSQTRAVDLSGKTMEGNLVVNVLDLDIDGGFVKIDTNDAIVVTITIKDISVIEATAIFPAQDVVDEKNETSLAGLDGVDDPRLRLAKIATGTVKTEAYSTAEDTVYFKYTIPSATKNGAAFVMNTVIRPAPPGGTRHESYSVDFSGYDLDLTGKQTPTPHDTVNTFYNELLGHIQYTGKKVHLSLDDSIYVVLTFEDVKTTYVSGYLGKRTMTTGPESINFDIFKKIESGTLNFEKVKINLVVENGLGVEGQFILNNVQAQNTRTGQTQTFTGFTSSGIIAKATDNPYTPAITTIPLNGNNAVDLINIMPDKINYDVELRMNPSGFPGVYTDFAYSSSILNPLLEIELPLSIYADQLVLSDTADFVSQNFKTSVKSGSFTVNMDNGFPIGGDLKLYFLDEGGSIMDSVLSSGSLLPGILNGQGRVTQKAKSKMSFYLDENRMKNILRARKVIFKVTFNTASAPDYMKFYSDYKIDFQLVGDFSYTIE